MKKRFTTGLLAILFAMSIIIISPSYSFANVWDGTTVDTLWYTQNPEANVFYINNASELAGIASIVNEGTDTFRGKTIILKENIDLGNNPWTPIGDISLVNSSKRTEKNFEGTLEGLGHVIKNLKVGITTGTQGVGFFGHFPGKIKNVGFINSRVTTRDNAHNISAGTICSVLRSGGMISKCFVKDSFVGFTHTSNKDRVCLGGLAGITCTGSKIEESYVENITLSQHANSTSTSRQSGALSGSLWGTSEDGLPSAKVYENKSGSVLRVENSYFSNIVFNSSDFFGLFGRGDDGKISFTNVYYIGQEDTPKGAVIPTDTQTFQKDRVTYPLNASFLSYEDKNPVLIWEDGFTPSQNSTGVEDADWYSADEYVFSVTSADELMALDTIVRQGESFTGKTIYLLSDIDLSGIEWKPVGGSKRILTSDVDVSVEKCFKGTLDGNNHIIKNMTVMQNDSNASGLFNYLSGTVRNLGIENASAFLKSGSHFDCFGTLAYATFNAKIENCYVKNTTVVRTDENSKPVTVGGLVGIAYHDTIIENTYVNGLTVSLGEGVTNTNVVVGGIAGLCGYDFVPGAFEDSTETGIIFRNVYSANVENKVNYYHELVNIDKGNEIVLDKAHNNESSVRNLNSFTEGVFISDLKNINDGFPVIEAFTRRPSYSILPDYEGLMLLKADSNSFTINGASSDCIFVVSHYDAEDILINTEIVIPENGIGSFTEVTGSNKIKIFALESLINIRPVCGDIEV